MTSPEPTTNEAIALELGYEKSACVQDDNSGYPFGREAKLIPLWWKPPPHEHALPVPLPDFEHDWVHAGPLLVELYQAGWRLCFGSGIYYLECESKSTWDDGNDPVMETAVANAWLAWKKEE